MKSRTALVFLVLGLLAPVGTGQAERWGDRRQVTPSVDRDDIAQDCVLEQLLGGGTTRENRETDAWREYKRERRALICRDNSRASAGQELSAEETLNRQAAAQEVYSAWLDRLPDLWLLIWGLHCVPTREGTLGRKPTAEYLSETEGRAVTEYDVRRILESVEKDFSERFESSTEGLVYVREADVEVLAVDFAAVLLDAHAPLVARLYQAEPQCLGQDHPAVAALRCEFVRINSAHLLNYYACFVDLLAPDLVMAVRTKQSVVEALHAVRMSPWERLNGVFLCLSTQDRTALKVFLELDTLLWVGNPAEHFRRYFDPPGWKRGPGAPAWAEGAGSRWRRGEVLRQVLRIAYIAAGKASCVLSESASMEDFMSELNDTIQSRDCQRLLALHDWLLTGSSWFLRPADSSLCGSSLLPSGAAELADLRVSSNRLWAEGQRFQAMMPGDRRMADLVETLRLKNTFSKNTFSEMRQVMELAGRFGR